MCKIDRPFTTTAEVEQLVELFESCRLPYEQWTHRAHLAVAIVYVQRYPLHEAIDRTRTGIQRYNETRGDRAGYHETITLVFVRLVASVIRQPHDLATVVNEIATQWPMQRVLTYYSPDLLWSANARATWAEPDLKPLDF